MNADCGLKNGELDIGEHDLKTRTKAFTFVVSSIKTAKQNKSTWPLWATAVMTTFRNPQSSIRNPQ